jgi:cell shape-determining protein MreC
MKVDANRLAVNNSKNRSVSRNNDYTTTSGMSTCRNTTFSKKRYSFNRVKNPESHLSKPKQAKSKVKGIFLNIQPKKKETENGLILNRKDFENLLNKLEDFNARLQAPAEIIENNEALHIENSILRQALNYYEAEVEIFN